MNKVCCCFFFFDVIARSKSNPFKVINSPTTKIGESLMSFTFVADKFNEPKTGFTRRFTGQQNWHSAVVVPFLCKDLAKLFLGCFWVNVVYKKNVDPISRIFSLVQLVARSGWRKRSVAIVVGRPGTIVVGRPVTIVVGRPGTIAESRPGTIAENRPGTMASSIPLFSWILISWVLVGRIVLPILCWRAI